MYPITWELQGEHIIVQIYSGRETIMFTYSYNAEKDQLTLTDEEGHTYTFQR